MTTLRTKAAALAASVGLAGTGLMFAASPVNAAPIPACGNNSLVVSHTRPDGATGHAAFVILFRNVNKHSCTLYGYPGLDALNGSGHVLAHAQRTMRGFAGGAHSLGTVSITPGHYASATVEWTTFNPTTGTGCQHSTSVATTPPNTTHTFRLGVSVSLCRLQVHPTALGHTGSN